MEASFRSTPAVLTNIPFWRLPEAHSGPLEQDWHGSSALEGLRRSLGLGDATQSSNPLSDWLGNRVSLGVRTGANPAQTGIGVDVSIWRNLKARGTINAKGGASVGIGAETKW